MKILILLLTSLLFSCEFGLQPENSGFEYDEFENLSITFDTHQAEFAPNLLDSSLEASATITPPVDESISLADGNSYTLNNYPSQGLITTGTISNHSGGVYKIDSITTYSVDFIDRFEEVYYIKDNGDGIWSNADTVVDVDGNTNSIFRETMTMHYSNGTNRNYTIENNTVNFTSLNIEETLDLQESFYPELGDSEFSSVVTYEHRNILNSSFFNNQAVYIKGKTFYTEHLENGNLVATVYTLEGSYKDSSYTNPISQNVIRERIVFTGGTDNWTAQSHEIRMRLHVSRDEENVQWILERTPRGWKNVLNRVRDRLIENFINKHFN